MSSNATRCCAVTHFRDGSAVRCGQKPATTHDPDSPLCYYHQRVANQEIDPITDESVVGDNPPEKVTARGRVVWMLVAEPNTHKEKDA